MYVELNINSVWMTTYIVSDNPLSIGEVSEVGFFKHGASLCHDLST
jgi:hypothetical protein